MDTGHIQARLRCWRFGEVVVDEASCKVQVRHQLVDLQPRVWHLLVLLLNRPGEVCSKEQLLESLRPLQRLQQQDESSNRWQILSCPR